MLDAAQHFLAYIRLQNSKSCVLKQVITAKLHTVVTLNLWYVFRYINVFVRVNIFIE